MKSFFPATGKVSLLPRSRITLIESLEVFLVAFFLLIASRYWSISEHVAYISIFLATALLAIARGITGPFSRRRFMPLIAFTLFISWSVLSSSWSPNFHLSFGRALTVGIVAFIGVAVGFAFKSPTVAKGLVLGVIFHVAHISFSEGSGVFGFLNLGVNEESGTLGLFTNRSDVTFLLGLGTIVVLWLARSKPKFFLLSLPLACLFLLASLAIPVTTMFFAVAGAFAIGLMVLQLRNSDERVRRVLRILYPVFVVLGVVTFWTFREPLLRPLGEAPDLSGRTIIWDWYFQAFLWEPVFGIGWGNTYNWPLKPGDTYPTGGYFIAHNGFLDIGLVTGGVGVFLIVVTLLFVFLRGSSLSLDRTKSVSYLFIPALVTYVVLNDIMATSLPRYIGVFLVGTMVGLVVSETTVSDSRGSAISSAVPRDELNSFRKLGNRLKGGGS